MKPFIRSADSRHLFLGIVMFLFSITTILVMVFNLSAMERNRRLVYRTLALDIGQIPMNYLLSRDDFSRRTAIMIIAIGGILLLVSVNGLLLFFLNRNNHRLREAERTKSAMISTLTHDARFYLTVLKGRVDLLQMKHQSGLLAEKMTADLQLISENANSLNRLLMNLNAHELLVNGKVAVIFHTVNIKDWLLNLAGSLELLAPARDIRITVSRPEEVYWVSTDLHALEQILFNLVHNAHKFSPLNTPIEIQLSRDSDECKIRVMDQGPGVPASDFERIFEPYVQLLPKHKGTGLGLSNARQFARLIGGSIRIFESQPSGGATFCLSLPLSKDGTH